MNTKKLFLLSILALSVATGVAQAVAVPKDAITVNEMQRIVIDPSQEIREAANNAWQVKMKAANNADTTFATVVTYGLTGGLVGAFTGTAIGYLSGQLFDATIKNAIIALYNADSMSNIISPTTMPLAIALARVAAQLGSKWYWEKPLRNKIINWLIADLKAKGVEFNEELTKTVARVSAWLGTVSQINQKRFYI